MSITLRITGPVGIAGAIADVEVTASDEALRFIAACASMAGQRASDTEAWVATPGPLAKTAVEDADALLAELGLVEDEG